MTPTTNPLLEALREIRDRRVDERGYCRTCMLRWDPARPDHDPKFPCGIASRALTAWEAGS